MFCVLKAQGGRVWTVELHPGSFSDLFQFQTAMSLGQELIDLAPGPALNGYFLYMQML